MKNVARNIWLLLLAVLTVFTLVMPYTHGEEIIAGAVEPTDNGQVEYLFYETDGNAEGQHGDDEEEIVGSESRAVLAQALDVPKDVLPYYENNRNTGDQLLVLFPNKTNNETLIVGNRYHIYVDTGELAATQDLWVYPSGSCLSFAEYEDEGYFTAVREGKCKLSVKQRALVLSDDPGENWNEVMLKATVNLTVVDPNSPSGINLTQGSSATITLDQPLQLVAELVPETAQAALTWTSNKPQVVTVDANGLVTPQGEGSAKVTVQTHNKKKVTINIQVVDPNKPTGIFIAQGKAVTITMGQPLQLNAGLAPESARATLTWTSSKATVATVDGNGLVTPVGEGKTKITVKTHNKKKATITVQVVDPNKPLGIAIAQGKAVTMKVGETLQLGVGLNPATAQTVLTWKTNKPAIATVDGNGVVTAVKKGKAKITVMTYNKKKATITVNVVP